MEMTGMFTIISPKAMKFRTLKLPATMYSWKIADTEKVRSLAIDELMPLLMRG